MRHSHNLLGRVLLCRGEKRKERESWHGRLGLLSLSLSLSLSPSLSLSFLPSLRSSNKIDLGSAAGGIKRTFSTSASFFFSFFCGGVGLNPRVVAQSDARTNEWANCSRSLFLLPLSLPFAPSIAYLPMSAPDTYPQLGSIHI